MKFSIITVSFNSAVTIEKTIQSVLNQTNNNYEYIIVDGGSTDGTIDIIKKYESCFLSKLRWISEPDKGIYDAMNKGIHMASGEIIGIVNSDDWLEPDALENVYKAYVENGNSLESLYLGWMNFHYLDGTIQVIPTSFETFKRYAKKYQLGGVNHPATFVPRQIYKRIGLFNDNLRIAADSDFLLRCYYSGIPFYFVNKVLTNMSDSGISNVFNFRNFKIWYRDRKIIVKNYVKSPIILHYFLYTWGLKQLVKILIPHSVLKLHRTK